MLSHGIVLPNSIRGLWAARCKFRFFLLFVGELLARCDAVLRVPGYSVGATRETQFAERMNMPVIRPWSTSPEDCVEAVRVWQAGQ